MPSICTASYAGTRRSREHYTNGRRTTRKPMSVATPPVVSTPLALRAARHTQWHSRIDANSRRRRALLIHRPLTHLFLSSLIGYKAQAVVPARHDCARPASAASKQACERTIKSNHLPSSYTHLTRSRRLPRSARGVSTRLASPAMATSFFRGSAHEEL